MRKTMKRTTRVLLSSAALAVVGSGAAQGAPVTWNHAAGGSWGTAEYWTGGTGTGTNALLPGNNDTVTISNISTPYTVTYDTDIYTGGTSPNSAITSAALSATSSSNAVALDISATGFKWSGSSNLTAGKYSTINVLSGGAITGGNLVASGGGVTGPSNVADAASGRLTLAAGGSITVGNTFSGGHNLLIANSSSGILTMTGGTLISNGNISVGTGGGGVAAGTATISGGSVTNAGYLMIGQVSGGSARNVSSSVSISGAGTTWANDGGSVIIGRDVNVSGGIGTSGGDQASLSISNGAFSAANQTVLVGTSRATGTLNVSGGLMGSSGNAVGEIQLGAIYGTDATDIFNDNGTKGDTSDDIHITITPGTGIFNLSGGAVYTNKLTATNAVTGGSSTISFTGGTLNTGGTDINNGSLLTVGDGTHAAVLNLAGGGTGVHSFADGLSVSANASITGAGSVNGAANVDGSVSAGETAGAVGAIAFNDGLTLGSGSTSQFDITNPSLALGTFDQITNDEGDQVNFGGALALNFSGGSYANGSIIPIFNNFGSYSGDFSTVSYSGLGAGQQATFDAMTGRVSITAVPEPATIGLLAAGGLLAMGRRRRVR